MLRALRDRLRPSRDRAANSPPANPGAQDDRATDALNAALALADAGQLRHAALEGVAQDHPGSAAGQCALGLLALSRGDATGAVTLFESAVISVPELAPAHVGLARAQLVLGNLEDAADSLQLALHYAPDSVPARTVLAQLHLQAGNPKLAVEPLRTACELAPRDAEARLLLGRALSRAGDVIAAAQAYRDVLDLDPANTAAQVNLGLLHLQDFCDPVMAERYFRVAIELDERCSAARANLGLALQDQGRFGEAIAHCDAAIAREPDFTEYRWNRAIALLASGRFDAGWDDYELRHYREGATGPRAFAYPFWQGEDLAGRGLLVHAEQGLGDEIMFASCIGDLLERGARVVLECAPRLERLFARSFPEVNVVGKERGADRSWLAAFPWIEWRVSAGSLPRWLRRDRAAFARAGGYLIADAMGVTRARGWLDGLGTGIKVGISWRGGTRRTRRFSRSIALDALIPLLRMKGCVFVAVQHDVGRGERELLHELGVAVSSEWSDPDDCASLLTALDHVITVANTNAHMAGALGRCADVLLSATPEWRWGFSAERSLWYPTLRLLRQERGADWSGVLARVEQSLSGRCNVPD